METTVVMKFWQWLVVGLEQLGKIPSRLIYSTSRLIDQKYSIIKTINSKPEIILKSNKVEKKTQRKSAQLFHHVFV